VVVEMRKQAGRAERMRVGAAVNIEPGTLSFEQLVRCGGQGDTGFVQFLHRWYDAQTGKWLSRDPIGVEGGVNLYSYTENNPVNRVDVMGLCGRKDCFIDIFLPCVGKSFMEPLDMLVHVVFGGAGSIGDMAKLVAIDKADTLKVPNRSSIVRSLNAAAKNIGKATVVGELFMMNFTIYKCLIVEVQALNDGECQ